MPPGHVTGPAAEVAANPALVSPRTGLDIGEPRSRSQRTELDEKERFLTKHPGQVIAGAGRVSAAVPDITNLTVAAPVLEWCG
jgi:hypothetical protein